MKKETTIKPLFARIFEVAQMLDISRSKAYQLVHSGELPARRIGGSLRVPIERIEALASETGKLEE
jgi:excisionase family DNA binding protein